MKSSTSPIEWLRHLEESPDAYRTLLSDAGCLAVAAHRVAKARCESWMTPSSVPTVLDLRAAAREIVRRVGLSGPMPASRALRGDCEALGLPVL